jgi:hypothetical protein
VWGAVRLPVALVPTGLLHKFANWQDAALAWCTRLTQQYPLYVDLLQPISLALHESCHGLDQLSASASATGATATGTVVSSLMAFPPLLSKYGGVEMRKSGVLNATPALSSLWQGNIQGHITAVVQQPFGTIDAGDEKKGAQVQVCTAAVPRRQRIQSPRQGPTALHMLTEK